MCLLAAWQSKDFKKVVTMSDWSEEQFVKRIGPLVAMAPALLEVFVNSLEEKMALLQSPSILEQPKLLHNIAHSIKGSAAQVCCNKLAQRALELEALSTIKLHANVSSSIENVLLQAEIDLGLIKAFLARSEIV